MGFYDRATIILVVSATVFTAGILTQEVSKKVHLTVFYEALCYDSQDFVIKKLYPAYQKFGSKYLDVEFVPFGKAYVQVVNNRYDTQCQHGPAECKLNIVLACGSAKSDSLDKEILFVKCVMEEYVSARNVTKCALAAKLDPKPIQVCADSKEGLERFALMGDKTPSPINFVPRVLVDGVYGGASYQREVLHDLTNVICSKLNMTSGVCKSSSTDSNNLKWYERLFSG